jgi:hypothetical protein
MRSYEEIITDAADRSPFSNHTEFDIWAAHRGCYTCRNDGIGATGDEPHCPILTASLLQKWPREWTPEKREWQIGGKSGSRWVVGECTEYDERRDDDGPADDHPVPPPPPEIDGQMDIFEVFADDVIERSAVTPVGRL